MDGEEIRVLVKSLDNTSFAAQEDPWSKLRPLGEAVVPFLVEQYPTFRRWQGRVALVYHSMFYARTREDAYQLGLLALEDKSSGPVLGSFVARLLIAEGSIAGPQCCSQEGTQGEGRHPCGHCGDQEAEPSLS